MLKKYAGDEYDPRKLLEYLQDFKSHVSDALYVFLKNAVVPDPKAPPSNVKAYRVRCRVALGRCRSSCRCRLLILSFASPSTANQH
jgi:hypothetical protein